MRSVAMGIAAGLFGGALCLPAAPPAAAWIALAPFLAHAAGGSARIGLLLPCACLYAIVSHWFPGAVTVAVGVPPAAAWAVAGAFWVGMALRLFPAALLAAPARRRWGAGWIPVSATAAAAGEAAIPSLLPWSFAATQVGSPWTVGLAAFGGSAAVTCAIFVVGGGLAEAWLRRRAGGWVAGRPVAMASAGLVAVVAVGAVRAATVGRAVEAAPTWRVGVVQADERPDLGAGKGGAGYDLSRWFRATRALLAGDGPPPDLVVWPETASAVDPAAGRRGQGVRGPGERPVFVFDRGGRDLGVELLVGALGRDGDDLVNAVQQVLPDGSLGGRYEKLRLVPLAEGPAESSLLAAAVAPFTPRSGRFRPGQGLRTLTLSGGTRVATPICYEAIHADHMRWLAGDGAELLVNVSSDALLGSVSGAREHADLAALQAVMLGRPLLCAARHGPGLLATPDGRIRWRADGRRTYARRVSVPLHTVATMYSAGGWRLGQLCILVTVVIAGLLAGPSLAAAARLRSASS